MASSSWNSDCSYGFDLFQVIDTFSQNKGGYGWALVLDSEKRELVKAPARSVKKGVSEAKAF